MIEIMRPKGPIENTVAYRVRRILEKHPGEEFTNLDVVRKFPSESAMAVYRALDYAVKVPGTRFFRPRKGVYVYDPAESAGELQNVLPVGRGPNQASKRSTTGSDTQTVRLSSSRTNNKSEKARLVRNNGQKVLVLKKKRTQKK